MAVESHSEFQQVSNTLRAEHARLSALLRETSTVGTVDRCKVFRVHAALTDYLSGGVELSELQARLAEIEGGE